MPGSRRQRIFRLSRVLSIRHGGGFFSNGLVLNLSDVQVVLQALKAKGRVRSNNSPMTVAKSGMPVTIRSDTKQTIFLQTPGTQVYGPSTVPYTFTTGLTVDIVARDIGRRPGRPQFKPDPFYDRRNQRRPAGYHYPDPGNLDPKHDGGCYHPQRSGGYYRWDPAR